ncbi:MAG TPA: thrombospondin type 3 repeat-containing protein [Polyangiaceae bacterium]|nr:thrombospondin type 3 repeat-containing protein [Polyangiaceae bacterium]
MRSLKATAIAVSLAAVPARAEGPVPSLDLRDFHPPVDPAGFLYLEPTRTPGGGEWNFGAYASYALSPVVLRGPGEHELAKVIGHQVSLDYFGNVGIGKTWAVGLEIPTVVFQTGDDARALLPGSESLPHAAIGNIAVDVKKTFISTADLGGFGLAGIGTLWIPTESRSYVSEHSVRGEVRALAELDLLALAVRATAGFRMRAEQETFLRNGTDDYQFGHDIPWGAGISFRPQTLGMDREGHWRWSAEAHGAIATTPRFAAEAQSPAVFGLSARYTSGDFSALFGAELPLNGAIGNPIVRPVLSFGWAPRFEDADNDGIEDDKDECPELAEDKDGFEDQDGCPDFDDDDDGVPDESDRCPKEKEDPDEFQDEDGCPDPDNDDDGVPDAADACPNAAGPKDGPRPGCKDPDPDHDGILGAADRCPTEPEDKDGFQDGDGCPDPDNDGDGVPDEQDACPAEKGEASSVPELNGCIIVDHDGDTFDDSADQCPQEPEDFDGVSDDDGCPEEKPGKPLVVVAEVKGQRVLELRVPVRVVKGELAKESMPTLRAVGALLNEHRDWIVAVGARPTSRSAEAEQAALNDSFAVALTLRALTHRDGAAESVGWGAVRDLPGAAASGIGLLLLAPHEPANGAARPQTQGGK